MQNIAAVYVCLLGVQTQSAAVARMAPNRVGVQLYDIRSVGFLKYLCDVKPFGVDCQLP